MSGGFGGHIVVSVDSGGRYVGVSGVDFFNVDVVICFLGVGFSVVSVDSGGRYLGVSGVDISNVDVDI